MKPKITLLSVCIFLVTLSSFSQKKNDLKSFISKDVVIKKYHNSADLENMQKGQLLVLYTERISVLAKILPYLAFATKPGITMATLGIPNNNENRKTHENQIENTRNYVKGTIEFQKVILPYSDTRKIASAILFYEEIMKSVHSYDDFN